jgi:flagellar biosynthesis protein
MSPDPRDPAAGEVRAVALRYDEASSRAPEVVARGIGDVASRILEAAAQAGVPVREDPDLLELLSGCHLGDEIPVELYSAVAELLTWLYGVNGRLGGR